MMPRTFFRMNEPRVAHKECLQWRQLRVSGYLVGTLLLLGVASCTDEAMRTAPDVKLPALTRATRVATMELAAAAQGRTLRGVEDDILRLEAAVPGIGGMYLGTDELVVWVLDPENDESAKTALRNAASALFLPLELRYRVSRGEAITIRRGNFAFSELVGWQKVLLPLLVRTEGFVSIDVDESKNQVAIGVRDDAARLSIERIIRDVGAPSTAVALEVVAEPVFLHSLDTRVRPVSAGYRISPDAGNPCTMGWNVTALGIGAGFVTAAHCSNPSNPGSGGVNGFMHQALFDLFGANRIGNVHTNPAWTRSDPECGAIESCTLADAEFVRYTNASDGVKRLVKTTVLGQQPYGASTVEASGYLTNIVGSATALMNAVVEKVGRTSGWTSGTVNGTCVYQVIEDALVLCAGRVTGSRVGGGDSGAPVFARLPSTNEIFVAGVLYGGTAGNPCTANCTYYYNHWSSVVQHLGLTLNYTP